MPPTFAVGDRRDHSSKPPEAYRLAGARAPLVSLEFPINAKLPRRALVLFVAADVVLAAVFLLWILVEWKGGPSVPVFIDLGGEANLPVWYSSTKLFSAGLLALAIAAKCGAEGPPSRWFFALIGLALVFMSFDETSMFHESLGTVLYRLSEIMPFFIPWHAWTLVYASALLILALVCSRQLLAMHQKHRREFWIFVSGGTIFVGGALGLEIFGYLVTRPLGSDFVHSIKNAFEEFMEMLGASLVLYAVLRILLQLARPVSGKQIP